MSETSAHRVYGKAQDIDARAAEWLDRRDRGVWTEGDAAALEEWLNEAPAHRITYWRMEEAWERMQRLAALNLAMPLHSKGASPFRIAAVLACVAAMGVGAWSYISRPSGETYTTSIGGRETIMLADGTRIELNTNSAVRVLDTTRERRVWLEKGEAFLQVTHDAKRPLIVYAGGHRITDLGTEFDVRQEADHLEVAVVEGRVRFDAENATRNSRPIVLTGGEVAFATARGMTTARKSIDELARELSWRRGVLVFNNTPLSDAIAQLNRYGRAQIVVADSATGRLPITGTLSATEPMEFIRMVQTVFGLHAERRNGEIVISR